MELVALPEKLRWRMGCWPGGGGAAWACDRMSIALFELAEQGDDDVADRGEVAVRFFARSVFRKGPFRGSRGGPEARRPRPLKVVSCGTKQSNETTGV